MAAHLYRDTPLFEASIPSGRRLTESTALASSKSVLRDQSLGRFDPSSTLPLRRCAGQRQGGGIWKPSDPMGLGPGFCLDFEFDDPRECGFPRRPSPGSPTNSPPKCATTCIHCCGLLRLGCHVERRQRSWLFYDSTDLHGSFPTTAGVQASSDDTS